MAVEIASGPKLFRIPDENMGLLESRLAELNKRAKRLRTPPIQMIEHGVQREEHEGQISLFYLVEIVGERPKVNGWSFAATIEHALAEGGQLYNILRAVPGVLSDESVLERYRNAEPSCDHCKTNRFRNDTYLLLHDDGRLKQVGSTCLVDFTGHKNPLTLARQAEILGLADELFSGLTGRGEGSGVYRVDLLRYLTWVAATIRENHGYYVSRSAAYDHDEKVATADQASQQLGNMHPDYEYTEKDEQVAVAALEWMQSRESLPEIDTFTANLCVIAKSMAIPVRQFGYAAYIIQAYRKATDLLPEKRERNLPSEWQGEVGQKITFEATCTEIKEVESSFGWNTLYAFMDASGNRYKVFTKKDIAEQGARYRVTATVKDHTEWMTRKETLIKFPKTSKLQG